MLHMGGLFFNCYGEKPYLAALVHGGPGAAGEMAPVAQQLSNTIGVIEPLQTRFSVNSQIEELKNVLEKALVVPSVVVGYSWGAMLSILVAAKYPRFFKKLILVSCPPLEVLPGLSVHEIRTQRLTPDDQAACIAIEAKIKDADLSERERLFKQLKILMDKTEQYHPDEKEVARQPAGFSLEIYERIWPEAAKLRQEGVFASALCTLECPVVFIHGSYDPHPLQAVEKAASMAKTSTLHVLPNCGHTPWIEKEAKAPFYELLSKEIVVN